MKKTVHQTDKGVKITFVGEIKKTKVLQMVENCSTGKCECMSDETKQKIKNMEVKGEDGAIELELRGDVAKEEIEAALQRSKILKEE